MELPKSLNKYAKVFGGEEIQKVYAEYKAGTPEFKEHSLLDEQ